MIGPTAMNRLTAKILDVINASQNKNASIHRIVYVIPPNYYLDWFEKYYPNVPLNWDERQFYLQCMNGIQGTNPSGSQWNILLYAWVTVLKYKKITIDNAIYIKVSPDGNIYYLTFYTEYIMDTTNNVTDFDELRKLFEEAFEIKIQ